MPLATKLLYKEVGPMRLARPCFLPPLAPACRHFFNGGHGMGPSNIAHQISPNTLLLPYAVALVEASQLPRPLADNPVINLLNDLYFRPARLAVRAQQLPTSLVRRMSDTHSAILASATDFAALALERISLDRNGATSTCLPLSPSEIFRFCRAFYRVELFYTLFRGRAFTDDANRWFFWRQPPWENEQLGCICCYLETKLDQVLANRNINAVDKDEQDFLDEPFKLCWLAQGVEFVSKLTNAPSWEDQQNILNTGLEASVLDKVNVELPEILGYVYFGDGISQDFEEACDRVGLHEFGHPSDEDTDLGPYKAWRTENVGSGMPESFIPGLKTWLRDRAYVLWDSDRVGKIGRFKDGDEQ